MPRFYDELRQRKVVQAACLYLVAAWAAVEVSATVFPLMGVGDWAPRLVLAVGAAGFPVAMWVAWYFDLGPKGLRATEAAELATPVRLGQAALLGSATVIGLTIPIFMVLGRGAAERRAAAGVSIPGSAAALEGDRTVAVLPFVEATASDDQAYFAEGITDEIVATLARYDGIRVLSASAGGRLLASGSHPLDVGKDLGAGFVLQGAIERSGNRLLVRPLLTDTRTFEVTWSAELERALTVENVIQIQRQVATAVAAELKAELVGDDPLPTAGPLPTRDLVAYDAYLQGNAALVRRTPASVSRAVASYRRATARDSSFTSAWAREAYASALFIDWEWTFPGATPEQLLDEADRLAARALALDSTNADAWLATAYTRLLKNRHQPGESLPAFERALALKPGDAEALHQYGQTLMSMGRYAEALSAYHGALALDPTRAMTLVPMAAIAARRGDLEQATLWADSAVAVGSEVPYAWAIRANLRNAIGNHTGARSDAETALGIDPSYGIPARGALATALQRLGETAQASVELERAIQEVTDPSTPGQTDALFIGGALVALGRIDEALDFIERARPRSAWLWFYLQHGDFDPIRDHPRFKAVEREADPDPERPR